MGQVAADEDEEEQPQVSTHPPVTAQAPDLLDQRLDVGSHPGPPHVLGPGVEGLDKARHGDLREPGPLLGSKGLLEAAALVERAFEQAGIA